MSLEDKRKKQQEKDKRDADRRKAEALPMNQAIKFLKDMKEIPELKAAQVELGDNKVVQYVPESQRREWSDTFKKHIEELNTMRSDMEERVAVNNPKTFEANGGKNQLDQAQSRAVQAGLDLKAWKVTYNVYLNAHAVPAPKAKAIKYV